MISKDEFALLLDKIQSAEREVRAQGQAEYAHDDANALANFERAAAAVKITREQALLVYLLKHFDGICSYVGGHRSQREDVRGRIKDARLYLALLWAMVDDDEAKVK